MKDQTSNTNESKTNNSLYLRIAIIVLALNFGLHAYVIYTLDKTQELHNSMIQENLLNVHSTFLKK